MSLLGPSRVYSHVRVNAAIEVADAGTALVLWISGELDIASHDPVEVAVMTAVASGGSVILDLAGLTFCGSNGVAMFVAATEKATGDGGFVAVRHARPQVRRIFELSGLDSKLCLID